MPKLSDDIDNARFALVGIMNASAVRADGQSLTIAEAARVYRLIQNAERALDEAEKLVGNPDSITLAEHFGVK